MPSIAPFAGALCVALPIMILALVIIVRMCTGSGKDIIDYVE